MPSLSSDCCFDAPETGDDVLNTEDFEPESSYVVPQVPVQQSYVPSSNSMPQDYYAPPQYLEEPRRRSYFPFIIGIIALGMLLGSVAYWYFGIYQPRKLELADFNAAKGKVMSMQHEISLKSIPKMQHASTEVIWKILSMHL